MKRMISLILAFAMIIGIIPQLAFASEGDAAVVAASEEKTVQTASGLSSEETEEAVVQVLEESTQDNQIAFFASDTVITTDEEFRAIASDPSGSYTLGASLSLSAETVNALQNCFFTGSLDGNGHTVSASIDQVVGRACGLFSGVGGVVQNLTLNATINLAAGSSVYEVGLLASNFDSNAYIYNCNVSGSITVNDPSSDSYPIIGGIIGNGNGIIEQCNVNVDISLTTSGSGEIGGIAGALYSGQICDSNFDGSISLEQTGSTSCYYSVIGTTNSTFNSSAVGCTVSGSISANTKNADGRIMGLWHADDSVNNAAITLTSEAGGIHCIGASAGTNVDNTGKITLTTTGNATTYAYGLEQITNGTNTGAVTASAAAGDITASGLSQCTNCTNEASVSANNTNGKAFAGGAIAASDKNINQGTIQATAVNGMAMAKGVNGNGSAKDCFNYGAVSATAAASQSRAYGIDGCAYSENLGDVTSNSLGETSSNSSAAGASGTCVVNRGSIRCEAPQATGIAFAYGIELGSYSVNYGKVEAVAGNSHAKAKGVDASYCENYGEVKAHSSGPDDADRGSATAYGAGEKSTNSYNNATVTAISENSAARAYGAGSYSSISNGTAYAQSNYYEVVTENEKTVYKMGYAYAGSSYSATAKIAGTAVTSTGGGDSKYIYFFMPGNSCETHSPDAAPCLTVEAMECGCYYSAGEAASVETQEFTSQIPERDDTGDEDEEDPVTVDIKEYVDNTAIEINEEGSAYAYYITEPNRSFRFKVDDKVGIAQSDDKGILRVPLGMFTEKGTKTVQVIFTYVDGQKLDSPPEFSAKVKVTSLNFTQAWKASLDAGVAGKLSAGAEGKLGPAEAEATLAQVEVGASAGATINISRGYSENGETLELSTDKAFGVNATVSSGITGSAIRPMYSLVEATAGVQATISGTYGIKIDNFSAGNTAHQLAIGTYLLEEALRTNPNNLFFQPLQEYLAGRVYTNAGGTVLEGGGVEVSANAEASLGVVKINGEELFSGITNGGTITAGYSVKNASNGEKEKTSSVKSGVDIAVLAGKYSDLNLLNRNFLGKDIEITAKTESGKTSVEATSLSSANSEPLFLIMGERTVADYDKYVFEDGSLGKMTANVAGLDDYVNGNSLALSIQEMLNMGNYLSASDIPVAYNCETKDHALYSIPFEIGATLGVGANLGVTLSYLEDVSYKNAGGFAVEDEILLTGESVDLSEQVDQETFRLEEIFTKAIPSLCNEIANFFITATGNIKEGVKSTWAWIGAKIDSSRDWILSITSAPSENDGAWGASEKVTIASADNSSAVFARVASEAGAELQFSEASTIGRPFAINVAEASENKVINDMSEEPVELTIRYAQEDLKAAGLDTVTEDMIAMYRYSDNGDYFEYVGGLHDSDAMTVTAFIEKTGQYILAADTSAPKVATLDFSDFRSNPTITATFDNIKGLDVSGFRFELDGVLKVSESNLSEYYNSSTGTFTYKVPAENAFSEGKHTITFTLADTLGNSETYEYEFTVDLTAPVIKETSVPTSAEKGTVIAIRTQASDENIAAVYAMISKQLGDGTWSEEARADLGNMGSGLWGLDYESDGSVIRVRIVAEDAAENITESAVYVVADTTPQKAKTPNEAVAEMTWGVNLSDLYMADVARPEGSTTGYIEYEPAAELGMGLWFWNYDYHWLTYHQAQRGTFTVSAAFPNFDAATPWTGDLFKIGIMTNSTEQTVSITLSDSKIVKSNGEVIALPSMDKTYTGTTSTGPDINGWCQYTIYCPAEAPEENAELNGATFYTTVTIEDESHTITSKSDYYFQYQRYPMDQEELTDRFLDAGANVIRLPVTWTPFVNDTTFEVDQEWLEAVQSEVDYILSKGAYCILNMHNDYLQRSFVGTNQNGTWTDLHWERDWMEAQYDEYVNARFAAVWKQIAEYFKDYSDLLIFETCNEPTMEWYSGVNYDVWINEQAERVNKMNKLFVETVRNTGGGNTNRFLCLAVAEYNQYHRLSQLEIPEADDYLMVQIHSYSAMENDPNAGSNVSNYDYKTATDTLFASVAAFKEQYPDVPVIVGEVGVTHRESESVLAPRVAYFFEKAEENGVPCLWWEDYFVVDSNTQYWLYDKSQQEWGRPEIVKAIQDSVGCGEGAHTEATIPGKAATCTETGLTEGTKCSVCGMVLTAQKEIPALGHTEVNVPGKAATCTEKGLTDGVKCSVCNTILTAQEEIPALDHDYRNGKCDRCGDVDPGDTEPTQPSEPEKPGEPTQPSEPEKPGEPTQPSEPDIPSEPSEPDQPAVPEITGVTRLAGASRYETSFAIANELKEVLGVEKFNTVVLANSDNFADALAGSYLAAVKDAPIIIGKQKYASLVCDYLNANLAEGGIIYILGGEEAMPNSILEGMTVDYTPVRLAGDDRYATNLAILEEVPIGDSDLLVATGRDFADSLSASATGLPILLVNSKEGKKLSEEQKAFLTTVKGDIYILGGESAVNADFETEIEDITGKETIRVSGAGRYETSVKIAETFLPDADSAVLAYASTFPDGLCGGPLAYAAKAPLLLTKDGKPEAPAYTAQKNITSGYVLGGAGLVSDAAVRNIFGMAENAEILK